jgi:hypothetical protein
MVTAGELRRRLEALERGPETQELKFFFYNEAETPCWSPGDPHEWKKSHPHGQVRIIIIEEVGGRELVKESEKDE